MTDALKTGLEWLALGLNFVFIILLIRENIWCWLFGIIASAITVGLVFYSKLYSETLLYSVYVVLGIYAWITWNKNSLKSPMPIQIKRSIYYGISIFIGLVLWLGLGYFFGKYTDSELPWADAFTTAFAFVATYLEAKKVLHHWIYWIIVNLCSIWLYQSRDLPILAMMMVGFAIFSIAGFIIWKKRYSQQTTV